MKRTSKYQLGYFETNDITTAGPEMQRWETLDTQLYALFNVIGNGVINGWGLQASSGLAITVAPGSGNVAFVSVASDGNSIINNLSPSSRNYIYAQLTDSSYWDQSVVFSAYVSPTTSVSNLYLGYVDTNLTEVTAINVDDVPMLGFLDLIKNAIKDHRHVGGTNNPPPVNLASEVQGVLGQSSIPALDASVVQTGVLDTNRIPKISHITGLTDQGTLTHGQLDSFVDTMMQSPYGNLGETALINLLQLTLSLKHVYPDIDQYLVNCGVIIPGISSDEMIDFDNTTAIVDTRTSAQGGQHTITGLPAASSRLYTKTWDTADDYASATIYQTTLDGDLVTLQTTRNTLVLDRFNDINNWTIITRDTSTVSPSAALDSSTYTSAPTSGQVNIGSEIVEMQMLFKKTFTAQDWTPYQYLTFYINTASAQHGDLYFFIQDGVAGIQDSYVKVLNRNTPTLDQTTLANGWQQVIIDISGFTRSAINSMSFMLSTSTGWNVAVPFTFNVDDIILDAGDLFSAHGYMRVVFGGDFKVQFDTVRWDAIVPAGTLLRTRARCADTVSALPGALWTEYTAVSGTAFGFSQLYNYIEIEMYFDADSTLALAPYVQALYLDYHASATENTYTIDTQSAWKNGQLFNIDADTYPNQIVVSGGSDLGKILYGSVGSVGKKDANFNTLLTLASSALPCSTQQALNEQPPALGMITAVERGNNGSIWVADADNDRVVELDGNGQLIRGFYGSFLKDPTADYGIEDSGPGSNIYTSSTYTTPLDGLEVATSASNTDLAVIQALYNPDTGIVSLIYNDTLENIYAINSTLNINKIRIRVGNSLFYLQNATSALMGVDRVGYTLWSPVYAASDAAVRSNYGLNLRQFMFTSHVLQLTLPSATKTALNALVTSYQPQVAIISPCNNTVTGTSMTITFAYYNFTIGSGSGMPSAYVVVDSTPYTIYSNTLSVSGLSDGLHTITVSLQDATGHAYTNIGATATTTFVVKAGAYTDPIIQFSSINPNQIFASSNIAFAVSTQNFPLVQGDQHYRYKIDGGTPSDIYTTEQVVIKDLTAGAHTILAYLVDANGNTLAYTYGSVSCQIIVGLNPNAVMRVYYDAGSVRNLSGVSTTSFGKVDCSVANIMLENIFAPVDLQLLSSDLGSDEASIVIGKLRSLSSTVYLAGPVYAQESAARMSNEVIAANNAAGGTPTALQPVNPSLASVSSPNLVFGSSYMDGHSVVQLDMNGNLLRSTNAAVFAGTRAMLPNVLGSVKKLSGDNFVMADSSNNRAIISHASTDGVRLLWQYDSDRYVVDCMPVIQDEIIISIGNGTVSPNLIPVNNGTLITWRNDASVPVTIYSGTTTPTLFALDPDLTKYGNEFQGQINPGETYSYRMSGYGNHSWFVYPWIITGNVVVAEQYIGDNSYFYLLESDGLATPYTSRATRIDTWGNVLWSFGEGLLIQPHDIRPINDGRILIST